MSHTNRRLLTWLSAVCVIGVLAISGPGLHAQNQTRAVVSDASVAQNRIGSVKLSIENGPSEGLSDFDGTLEYDPAVANVTEVVGLSGYSIAAFRIDNDSGVVRFIGFKVSGNLISEGDFLEFRTRAVGDVGDSTTMRLSLRTFNTPDERISRTIDHGTFKVTAAENLNADFSYEPTSPDAGQAIDFTDESSGGGTIDSWDWDFGDGSTSSRQNPSHTYNSAGTYSVELTVEDNQGEADSVTKQIIVGGSGTITFPVRNYPNPASERTTFVYELPAGTTDATLYVYTMDGRLVHQRDLNVNQSEYQWNLSEQPEGAYYYRVTAVLPSGSGVSNVGKLVIQR